MLRCETTSRVVVPQSIQTSVLAALYASHWGKAKVKQLTRRYVWWNSIKNDIEKTVKACTTCRQSASALAQQYTSCPKTDKPWDRLHLDFAEPFQNKMWLLCINACSQFPYIGRMEIGLTTTQHIVQVLKDIFAIEGYLKTIVTELIMVRSFHQSFKHSALVPVFSTALLRCTTLHRTERPRRLSEHSKNLLNCVVGGMTLRNSVRLTLASYQTLPHPAFDWKTPAEALHGRQP